MQKLLPPLDKALSCLIRDLETRGLLDTTIIWVTGEFGRTPKIQWEPPFSGGRGHWGNTFSTFLAGGGFKGGTVVGTSDDIGEYVATRPTHPADIIGTIYNQLGIDPDTKIMHPQGYEVAINERLSDKKLSEGLLYEII